MARTLAQRADGRPGAARPAGTAFDLIAFVPLASCTDRAQMLDAFLHALRQDGGADSADAAQRVADSLAGRRVLLVLDNFEQLVEAGRDDVARWLSGLPLLHVLVTSRRVLELDGEAEYLQQLSGDEQALLAALASCDGGASLGLVSHLAALPLAQTALPLAQAALRVGGLISSPTRCGTCRARWLTCAGPVRPRD